MINEKDTKRIIFLDNLRYLMVLLVVILHSAVSYSKFSIGWWIEDSNADTIFFDILLLLLDVFLMPILFFIAGYFAIPSFQKKNIFNFLKIKFKRLGIPLIIGIPIISPSFSYLYHYVNNDFYSHTNFNEYWVNFMLNCFTFQIKIINSVDQFHQSHLWFMSVLLLFFMIFTLYISRNSWNEYSAAKHSSNISNTSIFLTLIFVGIISTISAFISFLLFATPSNPEPWMNIMNLIQFQPCKILSYVFYFGMGVYAFRKKWFLKTNIPGHPMLWTIVCFLLAFCLLPISKQLLASPSRELLFMFTFVRSFLCISILSAFTLWGERYWNLPSRFNKLLSLNSYYIYIIHFILVIALQVLLAKYSENSSLVKFAIVSFLSVTISYCVSQYIVRPYPRLAVAGIYILFSIILIAC